MPRLIELRSVRLSEHKAQILQWLQQCCENHRSCNDDHNRADWNPTRRLDVGIASDQKVKLVDTASSRNPLTYVTLSHRWGQTDIPRLTKATEAQFKTAIRISELILTFQHAILVVRMLGYRYLWIDSLCIKQEHDNEDSEWLHEASLMHKVYRHGHFNISATGAVHGSEGLFAQRDHTARAFESVNVKADGLFGRVTPCIAVSRSFWWNNVNGAPLNERGWVLQERLLSRRVLHFGKTQLLWECRELEAAESFPGGLWSNVPPEPSFKCLDPELSSRIKQSRNRDNRDRKFWAYDLWSGIANSYSKCQLTKQEDKLVAITGLAKHFKSLTQDSYVAGMWRRFLASELTWFCGPTCETRLHQPEKYTAPTWSWLSRNSDVYYSSASDTGTRVFVKEVSLDYATKDEFGPLIGGRIYLEGVLRRVKIHRDPRMGPFSEYAWSLRLPDVSAFAEVGIVGDRLFLDVLPENFETEHENDLLFCMEVFVEDRCHEALLLRCEDRSNGVFSRVGIFTMFGFKEKKLQTNRTKLRELPCVSWDAEKKLHTICVI